MMDDERLAACFPDKGVALDEGGLDRASGGFSCPNQVVFYCAECGEAKTVSRPGGLPSCPDCGRPFGAVPPPVRRL